MLNFCRKLAVLILIAGLPLQNMHAFAMPLCDHDAQTKAASQPHSHDGEGAAQEHEHSTSSDVKLACDGCSMCQACSAPAVAGVAFEFSNDAGTSAPRRQRWCGDQRDVGEACFDEMLATDAEQDRRAHV